MSPTATRGFPATPTNCATTPSRWRNCSATTGGPLLWSANGICAKTPTSLTPALVTVGHCRKDSSGTTGSSTASRTFISRTGLRGHHHIPVDQYPDDYYFTDDLTDQAIHDRRGSGIASHQTLLHVLRPRAVHAPLQAKVDDIEKYRGVYDAGWNEIRQQRYERQLEMGVIPSHTELPPRNTEARHAVEADNLSDDEQIFARYMEIFAGMVDNIDQNLGRLRTHLEAMGEWDNTIIVFTSDNGGSREGQELGTSACFRTLGQTRQNSLTGISTFESRCHGWADQLAALSDGVGDGVEHAVPALQDNTHQGRTGALYRPRPAGVRPPVKFAPSTSITDLLPTLAELCGVEVPTTKGGRPVPEPAGASMVPTSTTMASRPRIPSSTTSRSVTVATTATAGQRSRVANLASRSVKNSGSSTISASIRPRPRTSPLNTPRNWRSCRLRGKRQRGRTRSFRSTKATTSR